MPAFPKIHWGRILIGGFLAVVSVWIFLFGTLIFFAQQPSRYVSPLASMLACFLLAIWVGRGVEGSFALHGTLAAAFAILVQFGITMGQLGAPWPYFVGQALCLPCGAVGGLVGGRLGRAFGSGKKEPRNVSPARTQALAIAGGLLIGAFLFERFGFNNHGLLIGWEWYVGAVLLGGIGLAGIFQEAQFSATIGLCLGPTLVFFIEVVVLHPAESMWPVVLPLVFLFSFPVPIIGRTLSILLQRTQVPRGVYLVTVASALLVAALLPNLQNMQRERVETKTVPGLLRQIHDAEMTYSAGQPGGNFACDGTLLPGAAGKLEWDHANDSKLRNYLVVKYYTVRLDCLNDSYPRSFRLNASSHEGYIPAPDLSMDTTGKLVVGPVRDKRHDSR
jgi:hypothetical protein